MIQIDMEMPKNCGLCQFRVRQLYGTCQCTAKRGWHIITNENIRPSWCPLIEVKENADEICGSEKIIRDEVALYKAQQEGIV